MLANENHSKAEVENMLKLKTPISKTTWYRWKGLKGVINKAAENVTDYRKSAKRLDKENRKNLEHQAVELIKTRSRGGTFCKRFMALAFEDVKKKEPFCSDAELLKLNFSTTFCDRVIKIYSFFKN